VATLPCMGILRRKLSLRRRATNTRKQKFFLTSMLSECCDLGCSRLHPCGPQNALTAVVTLEQTRTNQGEKNFSRSPTGVIVIFSRSRQPNGVDLLYALGLALNFISQISNPDDHQGPLRIPLPSSLRKYEVDLVRFGDCIRGCIGRERAFPG